MKASAILTAAALALGCNFAAHAAVDSPSSDNGHVVLRKVEDAVHRAGAAVRHASHRVAVATRHALHRDRQQAHD